MQYWRDLVMIVWVLWCIRRMSPKRRRAVVLAIAAERDHLETIEGMAERRLVMVFLLSGYPELHPPLRWAGYTFTGMIPQHRP